jgi:hypothetical protein
MRPLLELMPVQVVLDTEAGLLGAAVLAADLARRASQSRYTPSPPSPR